MNYDFASSLPAASRVYDFEGARDQNLMLWNKFSDICIQPFLSTSFHAKPQRSQEIMTENEISKILVDIFLKVHRILGPGLLESVYEVAICYELDKLEIKYKRQADVAVFYETVKLDLACLPSGRVSEQILL